MPVHSLDEVQIWCNVALSIPAFASVSCGFPCLLRLNICIYIYYIYNPAMLRRHTSKHNTAAVQRHAQAWRMIVHVQSLRLLCTFDDGSFLVTLVVVARLNWESHCGGLLDLDTWCNWSRSKLAVSCTRRWANPQRVIGFCLPGHWFLVSWEGNIIHNI